MKRIKTLTVVAAAAGLFAIPAQAVLVVNGGFEAGLAPWGAFNASITSTAANVHSGTRAADLDPAASFLAQSIPTLAAGIYKLDFWAKSDGVGTLTVGLDSAPVINIVNPSATGPGANGYTFYSFILTTLTVGSLSFQWIDGGTQHAFIDDVFLAPVPEPTTFLAGALLLVPFGLSTVRFMRNRAAA